MKAKKRTSCRNPNHPKKGSTIKVEPIRNLSDIQKLKNLLADNKRDLCLVTLGLNTAFRARELVSIKVGQVAHLKAGDSLTIKQSKNGKYRTVTINDMAYCAIRDCLENHPYSDNPSAPLFYSKTTGRALKANTISKYMKGWCHMIGLTGNYASHTMRKSWGYHVYRQYNPQERELGSHRKIAELMIAYGHATERQTLEYLCVMDRDISKLYMTTQL